MKRVNRDFAIYHHFLHLEGKGPSVWDTASHQGKILNHETGDVAADSYHKFREDLQLLKNLKVSNFTKKIKTGCSVLLSLIALIPGPSIHIQ